MINRPFSTLVFACVLSFSHSQSIAQPPGGGRRGGPGGGGPVGGGRGDDAFAQRLMTLDEDKSGGLSIKELPEHMQQHFAASDANNDGQLKGDEVKSLASHFSRDRMKPEAEFLPSGNAPVVPGTRNPPTVAGGRGGPAGGGRPDDPGRALAMPPDPAQLVNQAMTFDANRDGMLDQDELMKFAEDFVSRRRQVQLGRGGTRGPGVGARGPGAGGRGPGAGTRGPDAGRGPGGPDGTRSGPPQGNRPNRADLG